MNDLRYAVRMLLKNPGFTAVAVLTLALGIGANATVYSWIRASLVEVLPGVKDQNRLVVICPRHLSGQIWDTCSYPDLKEFQRLTNIFSGLVASQIGLANLKIDNAVFWVWGQPISATAFETLGLRPVLGRGFLREEETKPGGHPVAVISYGLWQGKFAGRTNVIGQVLEINQQPFTIVGIAPPEFQGTMGGLRLDLWVPLMMHRTLGLGPENFQIFQSRNARWAHTLARLQPGLTIAQAQAAIDATVKQLAAAYPDSNRDIGFLLLPLWKAPYGGQSGMRPLLQALAAVSALVLLIVIANLSSLQLLRAADRAKEMAVRMALGATRRSILRQLLTESVLLAGIGGIAGVMFAGLAAGSLYRFVPKTYLPFGYEFRIDSAVLSGTVILSVATGVLFGLAPAWQITRINQIAALKENGRGNAGVSGRNRLRSGFVVAEVALALLLLIGAGLAFQSFQYAKQMQLGLDPRHVLVVGLRLESHGYDAESGRVFVRKLRQRLAAIPGVEAVSAGNWLPLGFEGGSTSRLAVEGYTESPGENMSVGTSCVSPNYFQSFHIPVFEGREFQERDGTNAPLAAIINEAVAKRFFPGRSPIGAKIRFWGSEHTIVGVVKNGKYRFLNEPQQPFAYAAFEQHYESHMGLGVRVAGDPYAFTSQVRAAIKEIDPAVEPFTMLSMTDYMGAAYLLPRIVSTLLVSVSIAALFLAALGIYGVVSYVVSQRTREIGIRMALGATLSDIYKLILRGGFKLALAGVAIGIIASLGLTRFMSGLLLGVAPTDPLTFIAVSAGLIAVALIACLIPARRAVKVDPVIALRYE